MAITRGFTGWYVRVLDTALRRPATVLLAAVVLLAGVVVAYGKFGRGGEFFPEIEPDRAMAVERQLVGLFRDIGWIDNALAELGAANRPLLDRLRPIAEALHAGAHPEPAGGEAEAEPAIADPIAAFRAFEAWYEAERGQPFLQVFERYVAPTPLVEF